MNQISDQLKEVYSAAWAKAREVNGDVQPGEIVMSTHKDSPFAGCLLVVKSVHDFGVKGHVTIPNTKAGPGRARLNLRFIDFVRTGGRVPLEAAP